MNDFLATDFLTRYPDFAVIDNHIIQDVLDTNAEIYCGGSVWLEYPIKRRLGVFLSAAHVLTMEWLQTAEVVGAASSLASGSTGRSPTSSENDFQLTTYGRQYLSVKASLPVIGILM